MEVADDDHLSVGDRVDAILDPRNRPAEPRVGCWSSAILRSWNPGVARLLLPK